MTQDFRKPFTSPPTIFSVALFAAIAMGLLWPASLPGGLPLWLQLTSGPLGILLGVLLIVRSIKDIEAAETTYDPYAASDALVTSGIYRFSRNPGYLGLAVMQIGIAMLFDSLWILFTAALAIAVTTQFVIRLEEAKLAAAFGDAYQAYRQRVRRWI